MINRDLSIIIIIMLYNISIVIIMLRLMCSGIGFGVFEVVKVTGKI